MVQKVISGLMIITSCSSFAQPHDGNLAATELLDSLHIKASEPDQRFAQCVSILNAAKKEPWPKKLGAVSAGLTVGAVLTNAGVNTMKRMQTEMTDLARKDIALLKNESADGTGELSALNVIREENSTIANSVEYEIQNHWHDSNRMNFRLHRAYEQLTKSSEVLDAKFGTRIADARKLLSRGKPISSTQRLMIQSAEHAEHLQSELRSFFDHSAIFGSDHSDLSNAVHELQTSNRETNLGISAAQEQFAAANAVKIEALQIKTYGLTNDYELATTVAETVNRNLVFFASFSAVLSGVEIYSALKDASEAPSGSYSVKSAAGGNTQEICKKAVGKKDMDFSATSAIAVVVKLAEQSRKLHISDVILNNKVLAAGSDSLNSTGNK